MDSDINIISKYASSITHSGVDKIKKVIQKARGNENASRPPNPSPPPKSPSLSWENIKAFLLEVINPPDPVKIKIQRFFWNLQAIYVFLVFTNLALLRSFLLDPLILVLSPFTVLAEFAYYVFIQVNTFGLSVFFSVLRLLGLFSSLEKFELQQTDGWSLLNWRDPGLFSDYNEIIEKAKRIFSQGTDLPESLAEKVDPSDDVSKRVKIFNLDVAKTLLIFSAALYERDDDLANEAIVESHANKPDPDVHKRAASESRIENFAHSWGVEFTGVSDLNTYGGAFAGLFYDARSNWIVIAFKGTTPYNGVEFLKDVTLTKTKGPFLYGDVHRGVYDALFPDSSSHIQYSPYASILQALIDVSKELKKNGDKNINLYVTGHGIGSAIATAFYARAIKSPEDFGSEIVVRNGYVYGTPRIGDVDFASGFFGQINVPFGKAQTLFRIVNNQDLVTRLPVGLGDNPYLRDQVSKNSVFNYAHVGEEILIDGATKPVLTGNTFTPGSQIKLVQDETYYGYDHQDEKNGSSTTNTSTVNNRPLSSSANNTSGSSSTSGVAKLSLNAEVKQFSVSAKAKLAQVNPDSIIHAFVPDFIQNHLPASYISNLSKLIPDAIDVKHGGLNLKRH